jgi:MarR family transcriptional regulator, transcriptional regulator for hemolysin
VRPHQVPVGLRLSQAARVVTRSFDETLQQAGGSLPVWLILLNLKIRRPGNQRELAEAVGIREATLTHHLNAMDTRGLLTRRRDDENRRIHVVELTPAGEELFLSLQQAALAFDAQLRDGLAEAELADLDGLLVRLMDNAGGADDGAMPWAGLPPALRVPLLQYLGHPPGQEITEPSDLVQHGLLLRAFSDRAAFAGQRGHLQVRLRREPARLQRGRVQADPVYPLPGGPGPAHRVEAFQLLDRPVDRAPAGQQRIR